MYSCRDPVGSVLKYKQFTSTEPSPKTVESAYTVPRSQNARLNYSTPLAHEVARGSLESHNPTKITSASPYTRHTAPRRRTLPQTPTPKAQKAQQLKEKVPLSATKGPTERTHASQEFVARKASDAAIVDTTGKTIRPLSQNITRSKFHESQQCISTTSWRGNHGKSEKEVVGKLPTFVVGETAKQLEAYRESKDWITSLRVPSDAEPETEQWGHPQPGKSAHQPDANLPEVFQRLTDPARFNGIHKHRFTPDGVGRGLEGSKEQEGDVDKKWWRPDSAKLPTEKPISSDDAFDMPEVFQRLTNPKTFNGTHKHRFTPDGVGRGLEGRRDDESHTIIQAGQAQILRDADDEMDSPNKPINAAPRTRRPSVKGYDSMPSVFERLSKPSRTQIAAAGEYETKQRVRKEFGIEKNLVASWQAGL
eukprot:m.358469 g.358469  ORF g.358469 m.358469 type:complete len:421 (+) comp18153_c0_seq1:246-1508(+)